MRGRLIIEDETLNKDSALFTQTLIDFRNEMEKMIEFCFENNFKAQKARDIAFRTFLSDHRLASQYLAQYIDEQLKTGLKGLSQAEIDSRLVLVINIFRCLSDSDVFLTAYTQHLAKRLLNKTSVGRELEDMMIQKLKI